MADRPFCFVDAVRKVKNLLIGLPPVDADVATVEAMGSAGLQRLIISWTTNASTIPLFQNKMMFFFRNSFQGFTPTVDFQPQLLQNGGFDFGPLGTAAVFPGAEREGGLTATQVSRAASRALPIAENLESWPA